MISTNFLPFFKHNEYLIDEKVGLFKFSNAYRVYDTSGNQIGNIVQSVSNWHKLLRLFINKNMMPFKLEIKDMNDIVLVTIQRGWTFWMSKITIHDANDNHIGSIKQKFKLFSPTFKIFDASENNIGNIEGDWKAWNFEIKDISNNSLGTINKKWNGAMKEIFTTADKYYVSVVPEYVEDLKKIAIVSSAITIDMVLKESK